MFNITHVISVHGEDANIMATDIYIAPPPIIDSIHTSQRMIHLKFKALFTETIHNCQILTYKIATIPIIHLGRDNQ